MIARLRRSIARVLAVAWREATVLRHDAGFKSTVVAQPVIMMFLFGYGLSNIPANVPWAVLDRSQTSESRRLVEDIRTSGYFEAPQAVSSYDQGRELLRRSAALALLVVPSDFRRDAARGRPRVQVLLDGSDPLSAARVGSYLTQIAGAFRSGRQPSPHDDGPPMARTPAPVDLRQQFAFNPTLIDRKFFLAGLVGMLLTNLCLSAGSLGIVGERETGTYEQTLSLPVTAVEIVLGKLAPLVVIAYTVLSATLVLQGLIFGVWPQGSPLALMLVTLPFVLASLAIGVFVSSLANNSAQAVFISVFFIMPSFVLSGVMFPYQLMPDPIRWVGGLLPLRWYQISLRRVFSRGGDLGDVIVPALAMVAIFAALLAAIRRLLRPRLG